MMTFNPGAFTQAQLMAAAQQPTTPMKQEPDATAEALRYLSVAGGLMSGQFPFPGSPNLPMDAIRAMIPNGGLPFPMIYPGMQQDLKPEMMAMGAGGPFPAMMFDGSMGFHPYGLDGSRRKNATRETTQSLKHWLHEHKKNPYPTKAEKVGLAIMTKMTLTQVSTWFANARRRLKKENKWSPPARRGEEGDDDDRRDDDDMDHDRPGSSSTNRSDKDDVDISLDAQENDSMQMGDVTPKKKIWSIADTIDEKSSEEKKNSDEHPGSSKKGSPSSEEGLPQQQPPNIQQQQFMAAMARLQFNPQVFALMAAQHQQQQQQPPSPSRLAPPFFPFNPMQLMAFGQQQAAALNGSFSSEAASVSPVSSRCSPSEPKVSPKTELPLSPVPQVN